jgi:hypothetical protein
MRHDFLFLADAATGAEGKLYIHGGGLSEIHPPKLPWMHPQIAVVFRLEVEADDAATDHSLELRVIGPHDEPITPEIKAELTHEELSARKGRPPFFVQAALTLAPVPIHELGQHRIELWVDGERKGSALFFVTDQALTAAQASGE